jgi:hypothetical protein
MADPLARLPDCIRLPLAFDAARLAADVAGFGEGEWIRHFVRGNYEGSWSVIPLGAVGGETHPDGATGAGSQAEGFVGTPYLRRAPAVRGVLAGFDCPLRAARLMRLTPGSRILEHKDFDADTASGTARLHLPVTTNDGVEFLLNRRRVPMLAGELWYLRMSDPFAVANRGATDRVHLVMDLGLNDWLLALLRDGVRAAA